MVPNKFPCSPKYTIIKDRLCQVSYNKIKNQVNGVRTIDGNRYLVDLMRKKVIHGGRISCSKPEDSDIIGSRYCCSVDFGDPRRIEHNSLNSLAIKVSKYTQEDIKRFLRRVNCSFPEDGYNDYLVHIKERKRVLEQELNKEENPNKRAMIKEELDGLKYEDRGEQQERCTFDIPPAWYVTYRSERIDWGIHIVAPLVNTFVKAVYESLFGNPSSKWRGGLWRPNLEMHFFHSVLGCLLDHEYFHFAFNLFMDRSEKILDASEITMFGHPILYSTYSKLIYEAQYFDPKGATEEALASAWEFESLVESLYKYPMRGELDIEDSRRGYAKMMKERSKGYNRYFRYINARQVDDEKLLRECIALLKEALRQTSRTNRQAIKSLPEIEPVLRSLLPQRKDLMAVHVPLWIHE